MESKIKNAALKTALSFHYQVLIGLDKCLSLQSWRSIWFEKDGDVSLLATNTEQSTQIEAKNYTEPLTDHHENLWNTLKNWLDDAFEHSKYGALVLHTTQSFGAMTKLKDWNKKTAEHRLEILKTIYSTRTLEEINATAPSKIVKLQKTVMESNRELLIMVLEKVVLFTEADNYEALKNSLYSKLTGIPKNNLSNYLNGLIGFVYDQAGQLSWSINKDTFDEICVDLTSRYARKNFTFPNFNGHEATEDEVKNHQDKLFVQKIYHIAHHEVVPDAIGNWMEVQNSLSEELDGYPLYREKTKEYQEKLIKNFKRDYSSAKIKCVDQVKSSKLLYNDVVREHPINIGSDIPPIEYKNGLIHDAMDDEERDLKWRVEQ